MNRPLVDTLPQGIGQDEAIKKLAISAGGVFSKTEADVDIILLLANIDKMGDALLDTLAWQYHVDFYEVNASLTEKRHMVKESIKVHRIKGTPQAIEAACKSRAKEIEVKEWFEYGGEPYHFRVVIVDGDLSDEDSLAKTSDIVEKTKNVRSWNDGVIYSRSVGSKIWAKAALHARKKYTFYPASFVMKDVTGQAQAKGGAFGIYREDSING